MNIDLYLFQKVNQFAGQSSLSDSLAIFFAEYLGYFLIIFLAVVFLKDFKKYYPLVIRVIAAAVLSRFVIVNFIHLFFLRYRPFVENRVNLLLLRPHTFFPDSFAINSFPSGHAAFYFAIATAIYFYNKRTGITLFVASFLIGISRVFCGIHWPSDILVGALIGIFSGWVIAKIRFHK
ncbi:MAG: hypothetical protein COX36_04730 [Candidatus Nealsonbacteria bacterium CG23_combo_of_CG06-09_8_20_14_all_38_19]|uniref:Phosphatidic acid phosphatase type 2/haloperoxidase domain-containing protein n=1 Tax=Candidatus Nealsonbacteria bacterium CG23_combo_of_CG06-09_8_20_14_all_38_19 TaxID=1974721 RepID=A0A2G9YVA7_9BACT|nr:MAG: hypothetical protein COX36_04730 [Candidatus Nealsonbacteria bacterium CG23_combo_of_CG06-09_8_20_14_all_38_19]